jgi:hypothetical protein
LAAEQAMTNCNSSEPFAVDGRYPDRFNRIIAASGIALIYVAACASPAIGERSGTMAGIHCLLYGFLHISPPWLANPALLLGWLCLFPSQYVASIVFGIIAFGLGSMTAEVMGDDKLLVGFYLLQGTSVALIAAAIVLRVRADPPPRFSVRGLMATTAVSAVVLLTAGRAYRQVIPRGANYYAYQFASAGGPTLVSPDGRRSVQVDFNDAGAAHSGFHWTWLIVDDLLTGRSVVAQGYSTPDVADRDVPFPLRWIDDRTFEVKFVAGRYDQKPLNRVVRLP